MAMLASGGALFSHVVAFFGISFSDQSAVAWYALIAMICATSRVVRGKDVTVDGETIKDPVSHSVRANSSSTSDVTLKGAAF